MEQINEHHLCLDDLLTGKPYMFHGMFHPGVKTSRVRSCKALMWYLDSVARTTQRGTLNGSKRATALRCFYTSKILM